MSYDDTLRWLLTLPDFERTGEFASRPDVAPMRALLAALGDPHCGRPTLHIAGSKGKGSTGAIAEAALRAAGLRTGFYISPHLHRYTERIRIDGAPLAPDSFAAALDGVRAAVETVAPRFPGRQFLAFDALTTAAFLAFRDAGVDVQVVEVGLGGTLDSTNVFQDGAWGGADVPRVPHAVRTPDDRPGAPHVVIITPISLEHTQILGDTIPAIAEQKAGIITRGCTVVVAPQRASALDVIRRVAAERGARVLEVAQACQAARVSASADGQRVRIKTPRARYEAALPLAGRHQLDNAATALLACEELLAATGRELTPPAVRDGLAGVRWPGRLEVLRRRPLLILDGAHNGDSAKRMVAALREDFGLARPTFVFGTLAGKDIGAMAAAVAPAADAIFVPRWLHARAAGQDAVIDAFRGYETPLWPQPTLADAVEAALSHAGERGAVIACGALAFVAAVREYLLGIESDILRLASVNRAANAG